MKLAMFAALAVAALAVVGLVALRDERPAPPAAAPAGPYRGSEPPSGIRLADFELRDDTGELVRSRDLRGKVVVLTFLDSQCTESCPIIAAQIARAVDGLAAEERRLVEAVAISTDPAEDTPQSVRAFLRRNRALGRLRYVGGGQPARELRPVWKRFQILSSLDSGEDTLHSAPVRVYDGHGVWVSSLHAGVDLTPENLVHDVRTALGPRPS